VPLLPLGRLTALVLEYSLSMKPWSQVLTLYLRTFCATLSNPSFPRPSPTGREKASFSTNSSGLCASTRTFAEETLEPRLCSTSEAAGMRPVARCVADASAA
jgi:hypothetical protein